jgi:hypothetical protein
MKPTVSVGLGLAVLVCWADAALAQDLIRPSFRIRPIQTISSDTVPEDLPFEVKPGPLRKGFTIYYLVEGKDIACFDSLAIESIKTPQGADISRNRNGTPAYDTGAFPRTSTDGRYCLFSLDFNENQYGKVDTLAIKGEVTLFLATQREAKKIWLKPDDEQEKKVGPFAVQVKPAPVQPDRPFAVPHTSRKQIRDGIVPAPVEVPPRPVFRTIEITGPVQSLAVVRITDGDEEIMEGASWDEKSRVNYVPQPKTGEYAVILVYWLDMKKVKFPFGQ